MNRRSGAQRLPIAIVSMLALASAAEAETLTYGVDVGVAESDNVTLVPTNKVSQTMAVADVDFDVKQQSRLLDVDAKGDFSYLDYLQNAYGNQLIGRFDGTAHVALIPERLTWVVQDDFGQTGLDPYTPTTPANLENVNYVSTGPDLSLRFGGTSFVNMSARVANVQYQTSPFNSNRLLGSLAWGLQLSARSSVSLNGDTERVMFENTALNSDFDRTRGFVRYTLQGARTELTTDLGATTVDQSGASTTEPLAKIQLVRKLSAAAKLTASLGRELTDASTSFSGLQSGAIGIVGVAPAAVTSASYTSSYASAGWQYQRSRTTIGLSARWERDIYAGLPSLDYTLRGAEFRLDRNLTRAFAVQLVGRLYRTDYFHAVAPVNGSSSYDNGLIAAALTWRHGRGLEVRLRLEHNDYVTTPIGNGYKENRVYLTVGYRPKTQQPETSQPDNSPGA